MTALSNIEAKKRFEFLEAVSGTMDAHLRYFKQVYSCHTFHIDISRLRTNLIQASFVAISSGIRTTTSDGTIYQSSNSFGHDISFHVVSSALV